MKPGTMIAKRFEIQRVAGSGGMGTVYRAQDHETGKVVALKVLIGQSDENATRFLREGHLLEELRHPGIVGFVASGWTTDAEPYLVMDWLEGESLSQRVARGQLGVYETVEMGRRVAEALGYAHARGVIHRDLKPGNIFLPGGDLARPLILDFGIARVSQPGQTITRTGTALGSPGYMAPEQARGERNVDGRADLFSLGCVLFRCLAGEPPFSGDPLAAMLKAVMDPAPLVASFRTDVPAALEELIQALLAKQPDARPPDAATVGEALATIASQGKPGKAATQLLASTNMPLSSRQPFIPPSATSPEPPSVRQPPSSQGLSSARQPPSQQPSSTQPPSVKEAVSQPVSSASINTPPPAIVPPPTGARPGWWMAVFGVTVVALAVGAAVVVNLVMSKPTGATRSASGGSKLPCLSTRCEDITYPDPAHVDPLELWKRVVPIVKEVDATATFTGLAMMSTVDGTVAIVGDPKSSANARALVFSFVTKSGRGLDAAAIPGRIVVNESSPGKPIPFPACKPRDAYRAAIASGAAARGTPAAMVYTYLDMPGGGPEWSFSITGRGESLRRIEGTGTCPIKWKPGR